MATDREHDVAFWRHLASLHEAQAANLRRRAETEDHDVQKCLERAKQAQARALSPSRPNPGAPELPKLPAPKSSPASSTLRLCPSSPALQKPMAPVKPASRKFPQKPKKPISEL